MASLLLIFIVGCCLAMITSAADQGDRTVARYVPYAVIGKTIDKRRDVVGLSLLKPGFDEEADTVKEDLRTSESRYKFVETNTEANNLLNVDGEVSLQLELGTGQASASGTGGYLRSVGSREEFAELLFTTKLTTFTRSLRSLEKSIDGEKCRKIPDRLKGTHVITGIEYGASCIISVRIRYSSEEEKEDIKGKIKGSFGLEKVDIKAEGELGKLNQQLKKMSNVTVYTFCNAHLEQFPTNAEEGVTLAKDFPKLVEDQIPNGVPIRMELTPLSEIPGCQYTVEWRRGSLLTQYMENAVSMVQDMKSSYKKLWTCMEVLSPSTDAESTEIKMRARDMRERMKRIDYELKTFINDIDQSGNITQFDRVQDIYSEGHRGQEVTYGNRYWRTLVDGMCEDLKKLDPEKESSEMLRHKACDPRLNLMEKGAGKQWAIDYASDAGLAVDRDLGSCFEAEPPEDGGKVVWAGLLQSYSRNLSAIEINFGKASKVLGDVDVYISSGPDDLKKETRSEEMYHAGTISISYLSKDIGMTLDIRGLRAPIEGDSGYVSVLRLESSGRMILCEVRIQGRHCPTIV